MEKSINKYDLEEAKIKDEILRYCQEKGSRALIDSIGLFHEIFKGRLEKDKLIYCLNLIVEDGYLENDSGFYKYDFSAERFLLKGGYTQEYEDEKKIELGENVGNIFDVVISEAIDDNIKEEFSNVSEGLNRIVKEFENDDTDWYNIGNSCRNVLKEFVKELINKGEIIVDKDEKDEDVKLHLGKLVSDKTNPGRFRNTLKNLIDSVWDHIQSILHRKTTTKEEALRALIWTTLCINEIVTLLGSDNSIKD